MKLPILPALALTLLTPLNATKWEWKWTPAPGNPVPEVEILPLKYGKSWAYSVEIDDGSISTLTVSQPLLAKFSWNDAPPGIPGGENKPFVGGAAVIAGSVGRNSRSLDWEELKELRELGWSVINHSYWHSGVHWDKSKMNTPEQFRRELFWSQAMLATRLGDGRTSSHFVYPNGDYNYGPYLGEFGLRSGSRTSGSSPRNLLDPELNLLNFTRNYLDEKPWGAKNNPLQGLPEEPSLGDFIIDFTHRMDADPESANHQRWVERLSHIVASWGPQGDNSVWVAPTDEVFDYRLAAQQAKVSVAAGTLSVELPDTAPGSALTLKLTGIGAESVTEAPEGGTLYRDGDTLWMTTPLIGDWGVPGPLNLRQIYSGPVVDLEWDEPVAIAAVRILHQGKHAAGSIQLDLIGAEDEVKNLFSIEEEEAKNTWGQVLYYIMPDHQAFSAKALRITSDKSLRAMEVWAVVEN